MSNVKFTATKLNGKNKQGVLTADEHGYYEIIIGGLNTFNSAGEYYTLEGAKTLFEESSVFMRRVKSGNLRGELGHPKKLPTQTMNDYFQRILTIDENNVCCHFSEVWLDHEYGKKNPQFSNKDMIAIVAKVKPSGPKGFVLEQSLNNPKENTCFSIRALSKDYMQRGVVNRVLQQIVSWDMVNEPGLALANKYDSPSLETITDIIITETMVNNSIVNSYALLATEDSKLLAKETKKLFNSSQYQEPLSFKW